MGNVSYTAHISNKKSAITSKSKLLGVAKHNLRKYKSDSYSKDHIEIIFGTDDLYQDVKNVYATEFDEVVKEYNEKQKRADRKIEDYFEHVVELQQDMAVEIIFQCGDKGFWQDHVGERYKMYDIYYHLLQRLQILLPEFKIANAVIHFDEASPHMHVVGVPVWEGAKKGLPKKVSKRNVFTPQILSGILQDRLREEANACMMRYMNEHIAEKSQGRNQDLSVMEYKVLKEEIRYDDLKELADEKQWENELLERENARKIMQFNARQNEIKRETEELEQHYTDKKKQLESQISILETSRSLKQSLNEMDKQESERISKELERKKEELYEVNIDIKTSMEDAKDAANLLDKIYAFISSFKLFAPSIEEYANQVEAGKVIEAGNSFRDILYEIGKLLEAFKELIREGLCWFPRLMKWNTSKGEVAPVFDDTRNGYSYKPVGYMNVKTKDFYANEELQWEIKAENRIGTIKQMDANLEALERDLQEVIRIGREQERLWEAYRKR